MLNRIITFSLEHRAIVLLLTAALVASGVMSLASLPIDAFPDTSPVMVQVNTMAPALAPEEIEVQITYPIEQVISGLPGLKEVRSLSKFGLSQVSAIFEDGFDILRARQLVSERLTVAELPDMAGLHKPELGPIASGMGEVYHYLLKSDRYDLTELRTIQHWLVRTHLRSVPGVAEVNSWGGYEKQYHVLFDPALLAKYDLTLDDVTQALRSNNANVGGGNLSRGGQTQLIQGVGLVTNEAEIADIVLRNYDGQPIRVRDVSTVEISHEIPAGAVTADGRGEVVLGLGFMLLGENSREITQRLRQKMEEVKKILPPGVEIEEVYARTDLVDKVLLTARDNLLHGAILVVAALFVLGGGWRAGLIVAASIPLAFLFAGSLMAQASIAGSLMSLGAIDFGILVDSSVIVVENSVRHLATAPAGESRAEVVREACLEVRTPTMFGELIIMIVYLPILTLQGTEGKLFRPMALTVLFALVGSLILSLTLIPALSATFLPRRAHERDPWAVRVCQWLYRPVLRLALKNRVLVLCLATLLLGATALLATRLGTEFIPRLSEHALVIATQRLADVSLDESVRYGARIEKLLLASFPDEIDHIWTRTGRAEVATDPMGYDQSDVFITLRPLDQWKRASTQDELVAQMQTVMADLPGMQLLFTQPIEQRVNEMIAGIRGDVGVKIFGDDFGRLTEYAEQVAAELRSMRGAVDVATDQLSLLPVLKIEIDADATARYGVARRDVLSTIQALGTPQAGEVREGQRRFPLVVRLAEPYRRDPQALGEMLVCTAGGARLPLARLARIVEVSTPATISREMSQRRTLVQCNIRGRDVGSFVAEAQQRVDRLARSWAPGYAVAWGGQFEEMLRAQRRLLIVVPLAGVLIFALLYASFGSWRDALLIYSGVPFAVVGGVLALAVRGMPFSISAGVGFVALFGIAVLNGLVLVSYIRKLFADGVPADEAIEQASLLRLRPVLMTSATAALGFVPMMLATAIGAEVQRPLATVVFGGVISSLVLTLVVLPALYSLFGRRSSTPAPS
ncbi:MAG TPA: CusA/CzcA family heavy metal efflux RND transporter [Pirellulales bacterium]|nr:CusA/CzcA family heavy metal efflux RND transporter [Pirellulales bacterium]